MSVDRSKKACLRCVVQLFLDKLEWRDGSGVSIHLKGMPIFVRACVLGQLQHSRLHSPIFPLTLNQKLIFDRTLTNCRDPSLFKEVIRGEHAKIEVIQVTEDCQGGKILARYDVPAHEFLFPANELSRGELRKVPLERSRKYQHPPELSYSTSTLLMEATIQSPVRLLVPETSSSEETSSTTSGTRPSNVDQQPHAAPPRSRSTKSYSSSRPKRSGASRKLFEANPAEGLPGRPANASSAPHVSLDSTQGKLDSILSKYQGQQQEQQQQHGGEEEEHTHQRRITGAGEDQQERGGDSRKKTLPSEREESRPRKIKFKPAIPNTRYYSEPPPSPPKTILSPYHVTRGRLKGPHDWPDCPNRSPDHSYRSPERHRRSPENVRSRSVPLSPIPSLRLPSSPYHQKCVTVPDRVLSENLSSGRISRSPVKAGNLDARPPFVVRRIDESLVGKRNFCGVVNGGNAAAGSAAKSGALEATSDSEEEILPQRHSPPLMFDEHNPRLRADERDQKVHVLYSPISSASLSSSSSSSLTSIPAHFRPPVTLPVANEDLVSKYLTKSTGNVKPLPPQGGIRRAHSATAICDRLNRLREQCCECLHSADSLGDDELSEDLDRLRASLQGERDEALDRSSRFIPEQSVLVQLGPRDYWSKRMAEFTGKRHRVLFDETLEKIYNRLYTKASLST